MEHSPVVTSYLQHAGRESRPDRDEEIGIAARARGDDARAIERLVRAHLAFVVHVAKEFRGRGVPFEDLLGEGCVGLLKAMRRFDPASGARFMTYAGFWVRKSILQALTEQPRTVRVPRYAREHGRAAPREIRLEAPIPGSDDRRLADVLADSSVPHAGDAMIEEQRIRRLRRLVLALGPRERAVLASRYGLDGARARTLSEVGMGLGISRERVRQIEVGALARLRKALERAPGSARGAQARAVLRSA